MIVERDQCDDLDAVWFGVMARSLREGKERRNILVEHERGRINWQQRWIIVADDRHNDAQVAQHTPEKDSGPVAPGRRFVVRFNILGIRAAHDEQAERKYWALMRSWK